MERMRNNGIGWSSKLVGAAVSPYLWKRDVWLRPPRPCARAALAKLHDSGGKRKRNTSYTGCRWLVVALPVAIIVAALQKRVEADFVNGGFEDGTLNGWTVEYATNQGTGQFSWGSAPASGQSWAKVVPSFTSGSYTATPPCDTQIVQLQDPADQTTNVATRISQTVLLKEEDLQGGCGVKVKLSWITLLNECCNNCGLKRPTFWAEVQHNGNTAKQASLNYLNLPQSGFYDSSGQNLYKLKSDSWEVCLPGAGVGDSVGVIVTVTGCWWDIHGGIAFVDCAQILSLGTAYPTFRSPASWTTASEPTDRWLVGDFDGDGKDDLAERTTAGVDVHLSTGGAFATPGPSWAGPVTSNDRVVVGDYDGDGDADLASLTPSVGITLYESTGINGSAAFKTGVLAAADPGPTRTLIKPYAAGDFDDDGDDDLLVYDTACGSTTGCIGVMTSTGSTFQPFAWWSYWAPSSDDADFYIGDFNGDGKDDVARWTVSGGKIEVALSNGTKFTSASTWGNYAPGIYEVIYPYNFIGQGFYVGDFNCDGMDDLLRTELSSGAIELLKSTGTGFAVPVAWTTPGIYAPWLYVGNFDGDAADDVAHFCCASDSWVRLSCSECACMRVQAGTPICSTDFPGMELPLTVWNLTSPPQSVAKLWLTDDATYTLSTLNPLVLAPHLLSGNKAHETILISNVQLVPHTITVNMENSAGDYLDCSDAASFTTPKCECMQLVVTNEYCSTDGSGDILLDFYVKNLTGSTVESITLTMPSGGSCVPSLISGLSVPFGGTSPASGVHTVRLDNVPAGTSVSTISFKLLDGNGNLVCDVEYGLDMFDCPTAGWCCSKFGCSAVSGPQACSGSFSTLSTICNNCPIIFGAQPSITLSPIGDGYVALDSDLNVILYNLDESGENGVSIETPPALSLDVDWFPIIPPFLAEDGAVLGMVFNGLVEDGEVLPLVTLAVTDVNDQAVIDIDLGSLAVGDVLAQFGLDGELIGEFTTLSAATILTWDCPSGVSMSIEDGESAESTSFILRWYGPVDVTIDDQTLTCDEMKLIALSPAFKVSSIASADLIGGSLDYLIIPTITHSPVQCQAALAVEHEDYEGSLAGWLFLEDAAHTSGIGRLVHSGHTFKAGGVTYDSFYQTDAVEVDFDFEITNQAGGVPDGSGDPDPDGLALVISSEPVVNLDHNGYGLGYKGLPIDSFAIEFDAFHNFVGGSQPDDPDGNHVGLDVSGDVESISTAFVEPNFDETGQWHARVVFVSPLVTVYLTPPGEDEFLAYSETVPEVNIPAVKYFALTSATGANSADTDVDNVVIRLLDAGCDLDCNNNGVLDATDIADGLSADADGSGVPDECEALPQEPCEGDANGDGTRDPLDSGYVLARFGCAVGAGDPTCDAADLNGDATVDPLDVGYVMARFGECP